MRAENSEEVEKRFWDREDGLVDLNNHGARC